MYRTLCLFTGYYMYIEASRPRTRGQKARFLSPNLPSSNGECLTFYYNMNGRTMGTLNVYTQASGSLGSPVWTKSGNQGSKWQVAQVTLQSSSKFQVTCFLNCTVCRLFSAHFNFALLHLHKVLPCLELALTKLC